MSFVSYYGNPKYTPVFLKENLIDFSEGTLLKGFWEGSEEMVGDYKEFISIIFKYKDNLTFQKVSCSQKTAYIQDTKHEVWGTNLISI